MTYSLGKNDGMDEFQEATCDIAAGNYAGAVKWLRESEQKAANAKPEGPVAEIKALREQCEAKMGLGV